MPKRSRDCSNSSGRSPLHCSSSGVKDEDLKEWEDARCPVCMEHPHNAVLLVCSSYHKGCRPYMCDTSYRHSNCLDQFCKSSTEASSETLDGGTLPQELPLVPQDNEKTRDTLAPELLSNMHRLQHKLVCPLCRGEISGWVVVDCARGFMNSKRRSCACETCDFSGTYADLRKHARLEHPHVRPTVVDPERQSSWRRLERQRDVSDMLINTLPSSLGGGQAVDDFLLPVSLDNIISLTMVLSGVFGGGTQAQIGSRRSPGLWEESNEIEITFNSMEGEDVESVIMERRRLRRYLHPSDEV